MVYLVVRRNIAAFSATPHLQQETELINIARVQPLQKLYIDSLFLYRCTPLHLHKLTQTNLLSSINPFCIFIKERMYSQNNVPVHALSLVLEYKTS